MNAIPAALEMSPEELFIDRENVEVLEQAIDKELSTFEKQVLDLYITGMSYNQIARVWARMEKSRTMRFRGLRQSFARAISGD